jgi:hypothetical protein
MASIRKVIPVTLSGKQREKLERLWFVYGNHGPQTTPGNHAFIQGMLEHGIDIRPLKQRGYMPTAECERAVDAVLSRKEEPLEEISEPPKAHRFKLVSGPVQQDAIKLSPEKEDELKELIRSLQGSGNHSGAKADDGGGMPPAA